MDNAKWMSGSGGNLTDLHEELSILIGPGLDKWMKTPNKAFNNRTPNKVIEDGDSQMLWQMIFDGLFGVS